MTHRRMFTDEELIQACESTTSLETVCKRLKVNYKRRSSYVSGRLNKLRRRNGKVPRMIRTDYSVSQYDRKVKFFPSSGEAPFRRAEWSHVNEIIFRASGVRITPLVDAFRGSISLEDARYLANAILKCRCKALKLFCDSSRGGLNGYTNVIG